MTDKDVLFSSPIELCRRRIKVGGGFLYSSGKGTSVVKLQNGRHFFQKDTLLVPGLRCNLLLAKKLLGIELISQFDPYRMIFIKHENSKYLIEAECRKGLYIVSKISSEANGMTFGQRVPELEQRTAPPECIEIKLFLAQLTLAETLKSVIFLSTVIVIPNELILEDDN